MIRPHGHTVVFSSRLDTAFLLEQERPHHAEHIHVALQMIVFNKVAFWIARDISEMNEIDPICKIFCHLNKIIVKACAQRAGAKRQSIRV